MRRPGVPGFILGVRDVEKDILIPRYYDPRIAEELARLRDSHDFVTIDQLEDAGVLRHDHGSYIPKIYYGSGRFPYIRTSDLANWEIRASPKHGVATHIYDCYSEKQDVKADDVLLVHEGTYLIGTAAIVTEYDVGILYQHHLAKLRLLDGAPFSATYLLAALQSPTVQLQIRARQFSADIIDSVVGRLGQMVIPVPKSKPQRVGIEAQVRAAIRARVTAREALAFLVPRLDRWLRGELQEDLSSIVGYVPTPGNQEYDAEFLGGRREFAAFAQPARGIAWDILLPKYYDPTIGELLPSYSQRCELFTVGDLVRNGLVALDTGDEIGRLNYGTGNIPFIRTSDLGTWEIKGDAKQGVDEATFEAWERDQDVQAGDILLVRDGTYLVGSSVMITEADLPLLYCGGILKLRALAPAVLSSSLLLTLLHLPFVKRQIRNKQFTRDVIDTLGRRLNEVVLPIPRDLKTRELITQAVDELLTARRRARTHLHRLFDNLYSPS